MRVDRHVSGHRRLIGDRAATLGSGVPAVEDVILPPGRGQLAGSRRCPLGIEGEAGVRGVLRAGAVGGTAAAGSGIPAQEGPAQGFGRRDHAAAVGVEGDGAGPGGDRAAEGQRLTLRLLLGSRGVRAAVGVIVHAIGGRHLQRHEVVAEGLGVGLGRGAGIAIDRGGAWDAQGLVADDLALGIQNCDPGQILAAVERVFADAVHAGGDLHAPQGVAAVEGVVADARHAVREVQAFQLTAVGEGRIADVPHGVRDGHVRQAEAAAERQGADVDHALRDRNAPQAPAQIEHALSEPGHGARELHLLQAFAPVEGIAADAVHAVRDGDACQSSAIAERAVSDVRHRFGKAHAGDLVPIPIVPRRKGGGGPPIRHPAGIEELERPGFLVEGPELRREPEAVPVGIGLGGGAGVAVDRRHVGYAQRIGVVGNAALVVQDDELRQIAAVGKGVLADVLDASRDRDGSQGGAAGECGFADDDQALRECQARQALAAGEGMAADAPDGVRERDVRQVEAGGEDIVADGRQASRKPHALKAGTRVKGPLRNVSHGVRQLDFGQASAFAEGVDADRRDPLRDADMRKAVAPVEGIPADGGHAVRDRDAFQTAAVGERGVADGGHALLDHRRDDLVSEVVPGGRVVGAVIRHRAAAGDGQRSGAPVEAPGQAFAARTLHASVPRPFQGGERIAVLPGVDLGRGAVIAADRRRPRDAEDAAVAVERAAVVQNRDACQAAAFPEGRTADGGHALRDLRAGQAAAAVERIAADACEPFGERYAADAPGKGAPGGAAPRAPVRHRAAAGDGQGSGSFVKAPGQIIAAGAGGLCGSSGQSELRQQGRCQGKDQEHGNQSFIHHFSPFVFIPAGGRAFGGKTAQMRYRHIIMQNCMNGN